jgi:hypothetical protein
VLAAGVARRRCLTQGAEERAAAERDDEERWSWLLPWGHDSERIRTMLTRGGARGAAGGQPGVSGDWATPAWPCAHTSLPGRAVICHCELLTGGSGPFNNFDSFSNSFKCSNFENTKHNLPEFQNFPNLSRWYKIPKLFKLVWRLNYNF